MDDSVRLTPGAPKDMWYLYGMINGYTYGELSSL